MIWQDYATLAVAVNFLLSMIPTIRNKQTKLPLSTSLPTAVGLMPCLPIIFWTLQLYISAFIVGTEGFIWWYCVFRRRIPKKPSEGEKFVATVQAAIEGRLPQNFAPCGQWDTAQCGMCHDGMGCCGLQSCHSK